jgi:hypothetical protein
MPHQRTDSNENSYGRAKTPTSRCGFELSKDIANESDGKACFPNPRVSKYDDLESVHVLIAHIGSIH